MASITSSIPLKFNQFLNSHNSGRSGRSQAPTIQNVASLNLGITQKGLCILSKEDMELSIKSPFLGSKSMIINHKQLVDVFNLNLSARRAYFSLQMRCHTQEFRKRVAREYVPAICAVSAELEDVEVSSQSEEFSSATTSNEAKELKVSIKVSGAKTEAIFEDVFSKMVAAAQPIPGFRRVKGGKTPDIPRDILLEVLGPSKVYKQVIKKVINSTITEYVKKEGVKVGTDLRVEQSIEDLEARFEPGEEFRFDAVIQLEEIN